MSDILKKALSCLSVHLFSVGLFSVCLTACAGGQKAIKNTAPSAASNHPCQKMGNSDQDFFKAFAMADGQNLSLARSAAMSIARSELANNINASLTEAAGIYITDMKLTGSAEAVAILNSMAIDASQQTTDAFGIACEEQSVSKEGVFTKYLAIQISKRNVFSSIENQLQKSLGGHEDFDLKKFREIFERTLDDSAAH